MYFYPSDRQLFTSLTLDDYTVYFHKISSLLPLSSHSYPLLLSTLSLLASVGKQLRLELSVDRESVSYSLSTDRLSSHSGSIQGPCWMSPDHPGVDLDTLDSDGRYLEDIARSVFDNLEQSSNAIMVSISQEEEHYGDPGPAVDLQECPEENDPPWLSPHQTGRLEGEITTRVKEMLLASYPPRR